MISENVMIALISAIATFLVAIVGGVFSIKLKRVEKEKDKIVIENKQLKAELNCVSVLFDYHMVSFLNEKIDSIFENTKAERFIILFAINGKTDFNFVSVCFEKTKTLKTRGAIYRYVRLGIDEHYKQMLKTVERDKSIYYDVFAMPSCLLKDIYESIVEGVKHSSVHFISRNKIDEMNDVVIYSSLATTENIEFNRTEKLLIKTTYDEMRGHINLINFNTNYK